MVAVGKRKDIDPTFGQRLRVLRTEAGLTQAQLAEKVGMQPTAVARLELGGREPGWQTVQKLAAALDVTPDSFLDNSAD
jgi:transcriptional regulator with XRE-family HTH domain